MLNVRLATRDDREEVLRLVSGLLIELGGTPAPAEALHGVFDELVAGTGAGFVIIAEEGDSAKAVCTASFQQAIRTAGRYCIVQEMFVEPSSRSSGVGGAVLDFARQHAQDNGCRVVELGTPHGGQRQIEFYERAGFTEIGARMRWRSTESGYH